MISVPVTSSLEQSIQSFCSAELLDGMDRPVCEVCEKNTRATKSMRKIHIINLTNGWHCLSPE